MMTSAVGGSKQSGDKRMSYKNFSKEMVRLFLFEVFDKKVVEYLDTEFRSRYPGNYQIDWFLNNINQIDYSMTFDTPEDQTIFLLKYL
jgi:hypothetical protein